MMRIQSRDVDAYYPPPESGDGWRWLEDENDIKNIAGMDSNKLDRFVDNQALQYGGDQWALVVIRHGYLVKEFYTYNIPIPTRFNIWSGTKSFTGTAWGLLFEESRRSQLPGGKNIDLDTYAYDHIPEGQPLSDFRKRQITFRHLLSMTSGIAGHSQGCIGMPMATNQGPYEHALGKCPNRNGSWARDLMADPGSHWEYSDVGMQHLSLAFKNIMNQEIDSFLQERIFAPIGIDNLSWNTLGGAGFIGPHTNGDSGIYVSARELARFGYLALHKGKWKDTELIPNWWMEIATKASQTMNPAYGYTWWVNSEGLNWPNLATMAKLPTDAFALRGYNANNCYIIPSLDLVVARVGSGPVAWDDQVFIRSIVDTIIPD